MALLRRAVVVAILVSIASGLAQAQSGDSGDVVISGELRQWHKVTLTLDGPEADESSNDPNPFVDYRMTVSFTHESGIPQYSVPGYFAADGNAGNSSATAGNRWRAHFTPDKPGQWNWRISFVSGKGIALAWTSGQPVAPHDGKQGTIQIESTDKSRPDFRALGRLRYVGGHYLQFAGTGDYFLKAGADSPETLLGYEDFDGTSTNKTPLKTYAPHVKDWKQGDPVWRGDKGKGLIGALNYLSTKGMNAISFLPYNAGGDGDNVWPFVERDDKFHYDCSKLDQWQIVFDHAQRKGLYLHFKLQETEMDDNVRRGPQIVPTSLDGGDLGMERKLYLRELIARFGYALALNWNLGEENTQAPDQQRTMASYIRLLDPYDHHIVVHTFPNEQEKVYTQLLGEQSVLTGASLQNNYPVTHERTLRWREASKEAGRPWVVANDEQGDASHGVPPDPGYDGFAGKDRDGKEIHSLHEIRKLTLWGNLMAGGAGVEYYFGYKLAENDLVMEDFRSRDKSWDYARIALDFFRDEKIPFWEMTNMDEFVGNPDHANSRFCFAKAGELYLVYLPSGGVSDVNLGHTSGRFKVSWFDPRSGGTLQQGEVTSVEGGGSVSIGKPPADTGEDWLAVVRRVQSR